MKKMTVALALMASQLAWSAEADQVRIEQPWIRLAPPNAMATGAFMVIRNTGNQPIQVVKAANPASKATELHTHLNENGVMKMRQIPAIRIEAGGEAVLKPGGLHVMLIDMKAPLKEGENVPLTLGFEDGSSTQIDVPVQRAPLAGNPHAGH